MRSRGAPPASPISGGGKPLPWIIAGCALAALVCSVVVMAIGPSAVWNRCLGTKYPVKGVVDWDAAKWADLDLVDYEKARKTLGLSDPEEKKRDFWERSYGARHFENVTRQRHLTLGEEAKRDLDRARLDYDKKLEREIEDERRREALKDLNSR